MSVTGQSQAQKPPTKPCVNILIKPLASLSVSACSSAISSRAGAPATAIDFVMEESTVSFRQLATTSKHFARRLLTIGENRLELLTVEVQEERERLLHAFLLAVAVAAFGLLASLTLTAAIVVWLWAWPVAVLLILTGLYGAASDGGPCAFRTWQYRERGYSAPRFLSAPAVFLPPGDTSKQLQPPSHHDILLSGGRALGRQGRFPHCLSRPQPCASRFGSPRPRSHAVGSPFAADPAGSCCVSLKASLQSPNDGRAASLS